MPIVVEVVVAVVVMSVKVVFVAAEVVEEVEGEMAAAGLECHDPLYFASSRGLQLQRDTGQLETRGILRILGDHWL